MFRNFGKLMYIARAGRLTVPTLSNVVLEYSQVQKKLRTC